MYKYYSREQLAIRLLQGIAFWTRMDFRIVEFELWGFDTQLSRFDGLTLNEIALITWHKPLQERKVVGEAYPVVRRLQQLVIPFGTPIEPDYRPYTPRGSVACQSQGAQFGSWRFGSGVGAIGIRSWNWRWNSTRVCLYSCIYVHLSLIPNFKNDAFELFSYFSRMYQDTSYDRTVMEHANYS